MEIHEKGIQLSALTWLSGLPKFRRRLQSAVWRRLLSKPMAIFLHYCFGVQFEGEATFVGWPIFKGDGLIVIGDNCVLVSSPLGNPIGLFRPCMVESIRPHSEVNIGRNFSASGVCIVAETGIVIGNNVRIGANSTIADTDFHATHFDGRDDSAATAGSKAILIEDDVWIGMNVVILKGVTIHRGAVIGANAVVTRNVPSGARAVGNPVRII